MRARRRVRPADSVEPAEVMPPGPHDSVVDGDDKAARRCYGQRCAGPMSCLGVVRCCRPVPSGMHARGVRPTWRICCGRAARVPILGAPRASGPAAATLGLDIGLASRTAPIKASILAPITRCESHRLGRTVARDWRPLLRSSRPALCSKGVRCEAAIA